MLIVSSSENHDEKVLNCTNLDNLVVTVSLHRSYGFFQKVNATLHMLGLRLAQLLARFC